MSVCPPYAPFFGFAGVASAMILSSTVPALWSLRRLTDFSFIHQRWELLSVQQRLVSSLIPVVMSGIIAVYGLVVSVLISGSLTPDGYPLFAGFVHLGAGLACGLTGLTAGYAIGIVGDACVRAYVQESKVFVSMVLILIFAEVLGLYGLIVALIMNSKVAGLGDVC
ncbi:hypothetical protein D9757_003552 [Collybiopsis confluens]|uniref:V-type proton ATPase proteolipid subunit n=1 Tax=Collybiopsis confluens TaxID=2823264 RepID=A0A8H5HTN2_9AGAR|nr:hypothetical protein D9757_003552 [Collybiopsis confluens]